MGSLSGRPCVPIEVEMLPLHRSPPGTARLRRELERRAREQRRADRATSGALRRWRSWTIGGARKGSG